MEKKSTFKNIMSFLMRAGLSALLLWYLFGKIDTQATAEVLKTADPMYLALAGVVFFILNLFVLYRWSIFIKALDLVVNTIDVVRYYFIGLFGNLFLPSAIGGDVIKILGLCQNSSQKPRVVASVLLDRLSGFAGIVVVAVGSFIAGFKYVNESSIFLLIILMGVASVGIVFILFNEKIYSFFCSIFNVFPKLKNALMQMHYDIGLLRDRYMEGNKAIGVSCLTHIMLAFCWYLISKALHQDIGLLYFLIFVPITCVAGSFPSIGGLGVREMGAAYLFAKVGVESGVAVSISLINFLFMIVVGLLGGAIYVFTISSGRIQHNKPNAGPEPKEA